LRGGECLVVTGSGTVDLRDCPAAIEVSGFVGRVRLPGERRFVSFPPKARWWERKPNLTPRLPSFLIPNLSKPGAWRRAVAAGLATLAFTPGFGWFLTPNIAGGSSIAIFTVSGKSGSGTTVTGDMTNDTSPPAGALLVFAVSIRGTTSGTWTGLSSGWSTAVTNQNRAVQTAIFYKLAVGGGPSFDPVPQVTYSGGGNWVTVVYEYRGNTTVAVLDQAGGNSGAGTVSLPADVLATCGAADGGTGRAIVSVASLSFTSAYVETSATTFNNGVTDSFAFNNDSTSTRDHYRFGGFGNTTGNSVADTAEVASSKGGTGNIVSVCVASFKPLVPVTQTAALRYESLKGVAQTATEPYSATKGVAATAAEPYESVKGVAATGAEPYESGAGIAATGVLPYSALAGVRATGALPYEDLLALARAGELPYESLLGLVVTGVLPYETLVGLAATADLSYEALAGLAVSGDLPYEAIAQIAQTADLPYEDLEGGVAILAGLPYETTGGIHVTQVAVLPFEALAGVLVADAMAYETLEALFAAAVLPFEALGQHPVLIGVTDGMIVAVAGADGSVVVVASADGAQFARDVAAGLISPTGAGSGEIVPTSSTDGSIQP
jgi:hypothetical protein